MSFDFEHAVQSPFRMQPGLRRLAVGASQLSPNRLGSRHLREKMAVLFHFAPEALLMAPGFDPEPALHALARHAAQEHPGCWQVAADGRWEALALGWAVDRQGHVADLGSTWPELGQCLRRLPPAWRRAGLLSLAFAEDFAIVDGQRASLPWLAVALPSNWAPEEKIGRHFAEVHAPVADSAVLIKAGAHLMGLVTGPERWERFVWNISRHPRLHAHPARVDPAPWPAAPGPEALAGQAWFRTERQTFIPLPQARQAVFTIRVDTQPLAQALPSPQAARRLHDALASMSPAVLAYRALDPARDRLLAWLRARSA